MTRMMLLLCATLLFAVSVTATSAASPMKEGLWEITTVTEMPGIPFKIPPTTVTHCYSKDDVSDQKKVVTSGDKNCTVSDFKATGNKVSWTMICTGDNPGTFKGETTFSGDSYSSIMKMDAGGHKATMNVKGKRVGVCP